LSGHAARAPGEGAAGVDPSAYVAPTAVLCGDVRVGPDARILFGAVLTAEDGTAEVGARCVVMEQALRRGRGRHRLTVGDDVLVAPHARCFIAFAAHRDDKML
jgi:carbonic anhydrase/acetyltransferase-like protein (isoleucine patch superfamily)